jgi:hypothetical protein
VTSTIEAITVATSFGTICLPNTDRSARYWMISAELTVALASVATDPGATVLTEMPNWPA